MKRPSRTTLVGSAFVLAALAIVVRAADVQLVHGDAWRRRAAEQQTVRVELPARRGGLFDRHGVALALSQETYDVGVAPREVSDPGRAARLLSQAVGVPRREIAQLLRSDRVWWEWRGPYTWSDVAPLKSVRGVYLLRRLRRLYPRPDLAPRLIGRAGLDGHGMSGLERALDTVLAGRPGSAVMLRDRGGQTYPSPSRPSADPVPGDDVYLTLDAELEDITQRALTAAVDSVHASGGDAVILQPATGEILALASVRRGGAEGSGLGDTFEPGSTAKVFAAAALLRTGKAGADDSVFAEHGHFVYKGRSIDDVHGEGWLTLANVIRVSSNIGIVKFASRLTSAEQYEALRDFGFGTPTGVEAAGESPGTLRHPRAWSGESQASLAMGYELAVTPLQLAAAYASLADGGVLLEPTLVREVRDPDGVVRYTARPEPVRRVVSKRVANMLTHMLQNVVEEGTGRRAALGTYPVAGKTGTTRRPIQGHYLPGHYWASFVGIFPAVDPQLVLVVKIDDPQGEYFGGSVSAPVVRTILEASLATPGVTLDRSRLVRHRLADTAGASPAAAEAPAPVMLPWPPVPLQPRAAAPASRPVPDVAGLSLRAAARALHRHGFEVRIEGWGRVVATSPPAGTAAATGSAVTVHASETRAH
jgi:cell division protein FtsI (penicillin-binding protein 3)